MYHRRSRIRLNQKPDHARQLERNLVTSLVLYESIRTTRKRAKVIQPLFDRLITVAKTKNQVNAIRDINAFVTDKNACRKILEVLAKRFDARSSGYTTAKPAGARRGDGAELVDLSLMDADKVVAAPAKEPKAKKPAKTKKVAASKDTDSSAK